MEENISIKNSIINNNSKIESQVIYGESGNNNDTFDYITFSKLLNDVFESSDNKAECRCALEARQYANNKDKTNLKQYLKKNFTTFTTGTFATLAGGLLVEMVKRFVGY